MAKDLRKKFELPYIGVDTSHNPIHILYGNKGEATVVFRIVNSVLQYSADQSHYVDYHAHMLNVIKIMGEGHFIQKLDVFSNQVFEENISEEYLQKKYDDHFKGRVYKGIKTFLAITRKSKNSRYTYNAKADEEFKQKILKIEQLLGDTKFEPKLLQENEINDLVRRTLMMDFSSPVVKMDNVKTHNSHINIGDKFVKCLSLVDIDSIDLPEVIAPYVERNDKEALKGFPIDTMAFLHGVTGYDTLIYNQVIEIPEQRKTLLKLEQKKKRHQGVPDPQNDFCVQDIEQLLHDVVKANQLVVNAHFNIVVSAKEDELSRALNSIENALFTQGIIASKNSYNQLELFRTILVGNSVELKEYDLFQTTSDASLCFFFKEALPVSEPSQFFLRFTDRQGIPLKIDPADLPYQSGRINNRNKFVLGPSGSGKSFLMNSIVEQYMLYNYDLVIVDTGDSYSGTCSYYNGKYITYTEEKPITMNPFLMSKEEYNLEKKEFLITLTGLLWKGADGVISQVEHDVLTDVVSSYYENFFEQKDENWVRSLSIPEMEKYLSDNGISPTLLLENARVKLIGERSEVTDYYSILKVDRLADKEEIKRQFRKLSQIYHPDKAQVSDIAESSELFIAIKNAYEVLSNDTTRKKYDEVALINKLSKNIENGAYDEATNTDLIKAYTEEMVKRICELLDDFKISRLCFDTFYEFSLKRIPNIIASENIKFDLHVFKYVLKKFYKGGEFDMILNEQADQSLFAERFIVFEIDNIKEHKILFPIVTLIIMDVFIQKMRLRENQRKALIIEEAWKAIASPLMAGYILYLYKTVRKWWGEAIVVTQELNDILGNAVVKDSIVNNSDSIILLDQTKFKDNFGEIADLLSLNAVEQRKIFTINNLDNKDNRSRFKEFYFKRGDSGEVYGNEVALQQYLTYTTEKPEKNAVKIYYKKYGTYPDGLDKFVDTLKRSSLPMPVLVHFINLYGKVLTDDVLSVIIELTKEHKNNTLNWVKRYLKNNDLSFYEFVHEKIRKDEKIAI